MGSWGKAPALGVRGRIPGGVRGKAPVLGKEWTLLGIGTGFGFGFGFGLALDMTNSRFICLTGHINGEMGVFVHGFFIRRTYRACYRQENNSIYEEGRTGFFLQPEICCRRWYERCETQNHTRQCGRSIRSRCEHSLASVLCLGAETLLSPLWFKLPLEYGGYDEKEEIS